MAYDQQWTSDRPGCLVILVDQSDSMRDRIGSQGAPPEAEGDAGRIPADSKAQRVADIINGIIRAFLDLSADGATYKERMHLAVVGYHGEHTISSALHSPANQPKADAGVDGLLAHFMTPLDLAQNPLRVVTVETTRTNVRGEKMIIPDQRRIWVEGKAEGRTPMSQALQRAAELTAVWAARHPLSYPPVVINISDGLATDGEIEGPGRSLLAVRTDDGAALLFNCHISIDTASKRVEFPNDKSLVPDKKGAADLFWLSSLIPTTARAVFREETGRTLQEGTRGYIFNGDPASVRRMLIIGSTTGRPDERE